jgi:hypothetical protein
MRTEENLSPNEESIKSAYLFGTKSIRQIAKEHGVSDAWVRKLARRHDWGARPTVGSQPSSQPSSQPGSHPSTALVVIRESASERVEPSPSPRDADEPSETIQKAARTDPHVLADGTLDVLSRLKDELDAVTTHVGELEAMIEAATKDDARARGAMMRAVSLPTRILAAKNLALALRTLQEAQPGKKEQRRQAAETAGMGSLWGDDLEVDIARAN